MIILPTKRRLERRRDALYEHLRSVIPIASVHQVESIMRQTHIINAKIKTYFIRPDHHETEEIFDRD